MKFHEVSSTGYGEIRSFYVKSHLRLADNPASGHEDVSSTSHHRVEYMHLFLTIFCFLIVWFMLKNPNNTHLLCHIDGLERCLQALKCIKSVLKTLFLTNMEHIWSLYITIMALTYICHGYFIKICVYIIQ